MPHVSRHSPRRERGRDRTIIYLCLIVAFVLCVGFLWSNPYVDFPWEMYERRYATSIRPRVAAVQAAIRRQEERFSPYHGVRAEENHNGDETESATPPDIEKEKAALEFWMVEVQPRIIQRAEPQYPEIARRAGIEGVVTVMLVIGTDGRVESVRALAGPAIFLDEAVRTAYRMAFAPAYQNGWPVRVKTTQRIVFRLN